MDLRRIVFAAALSALGCGSSTVAATQQIGPSEVDFPDEWYPLDDAGAIGRDQSGKQRDALPIAVSGTSDATRGDVALFDGGALLIAPVMKEDFTIAFYLRTSQQGPNSTFWVDGPRLINADLPGARLDFNLSILLDKLALGAGTPGDATLDSTALLSQRSVVDGSWHHVAISRSGEQGLWSIFVDGMPDATRVGATGPLTIPQTISFGALANTSPAPPPLQAEISDARLYSRVLSSTGIAFLATH
jgi:hypothetical protein